jgi:hypothetical protein
LDPTIEEVGNPSWRPQKKYLNFQFLNTFLKFLVIKMLILDPAPDSFNMNLKHCSEKNRFCANLVKNNNSTIYIVDEIKPSG